ncbi:phage tail protein [Staphylococcus epidermidis]|nr:phage tail protein [Staphylococcus epidermidis]
MAQNKYIAVIGITDEKILAQLPTQEDAVLCASLAEGGHTISNDLAEMIQGGKKDYNTNSVEEEFKLTLERVPGDPGQEALKQSVKQFKELRLWIYETKKREGKHHGTFAYIYIEEQEWSFDDEDDKIEITAKARFNSADGTEDILPEEWLNPSAQATTVEFEHIGEYTGTLENRTAKSGA